MNRGMETGPGSGFGSDPWAAGDYPGVGCGNPDVYSRAKLISTGVCLGGGWLVCAWLRHYLAGGQSRW